MRLTLSSSIARRAVPIVAALVLAAVDVGPAEETPAGDVDDPLAVYDALIADEDREHWSFQPVVRPEVPGVSDTSWPRNPIDRFVLAKLEAEGWRPAPPAAPLALLRRLYLDLIGLPPTPAEQDAFMREPTPEALDRMVGDLLARPGHGERWARHWLDLVRYAETNGYERDATKPYVWRYRDYVIRALNDDKPYDRFVVEQIAGDELPDADTETLIATGLHRLGPWDDEPANPATDRYDQLDDMVSTTSLVFLGLTTGCARCHNHKFEPITMADYYRLVAIFDPLERSRDGRTELDLPAASRDVVERVAERDRRIAELEGEIRAVMDEFRAEFLTAGKSALPEEVVEAFLTPSDDRTEGQKELVTNKNHVTQLNRELGAAWPADREQIVATDEAEIKRLKAELPDPPRGYFLHEPTSSVAPTHVLLRGKPGSPGPAVAPGFPAVLVAEQPEIEAPSPHTTGRRLALARWIASPDHPLTARVIVNRVWQYHFGEGIVRSPSDFGLMGLEPSHPELLDWLADWFVHDADWSLKALHRLITTSNTYRMNRRWRADYGDADPDDWLWWRAPVRRLEVEAIRDSMLAASGQLDRRMYGPSMYPYVPAAALEGHSDPNDIWKPFDEADASRRTIYAFIKRSMVVPMLEVLDLCDTTRSAPRRIVTTVAPQALTMFNGEFVNRQARHLADRLLDEAGDGHDAQIDLAYRLVLCRPATETEQATMSTFLAAETQAAFAETGSADQALAERQALIQMCRVMFNLNEFAYPD